MRVRSKSHNLKRLISIQSRIKWMILLNSLRINLRNLREIEGIRRLSPRKDLLLNRDRINKRMIQIREVLMKKNGRIFLFKISIYDF